MLKVTPIALCKHNKIKIQLATFDLFSNSQLYRFVGRINFKTEEDKLQKIFSKYGEIKWLRLVRDVVTGHSKGYAFVSYKNRSDADRAFDNCSRLVVDERELIVDYENERNLKGIFKRGYLHIH